MPGFPGSFLLSFWLSGRIAHTWGRRHAFYFACVRGLFVAALTLRIPEPLRGAAETGRPAARLRAGSPCRDVLGIPTMWWIIASDALSNFKMYASGGCLPVFPSRYHLLNLKESNNLSANVFGAAGVCGLAEGGWMADRLGKRWRAGRLLFGAMTLALASPFVYLALAKVTGAIVGFTLLLGTSLALRDV